MPSVGAYDGARLRILGRRRVNALLAGGASNPELVRALATAHIVPLHPAVVSPRCARRILSVVQIPARSVHDSHTHTCGHPPRSRTNGQGQSMAQRDVRQASIDAESPCPRG